PHRSEAYASDEGMGSAYPITEELASTVFSLPMGPHLEKQEAEEVVKADREFLQGSRP
ncbi:MAG: hypothetical protein H6Q84_1477, partial [Deltaproteobacteria bacterium]|nr:hypothetical protein [Deltaproteobacteria bacterium]